MIRTEEVGKYNSYLLTCGKPKQKSVYFYCPCFKINVLKIRVWRKQLENVSQTGGNALQEETQRLTCQKRDGIVPELKFISKFTGLQWQTLKAYLSWQCKTK